MKRIINIALLFSVVLAFSSACSSTPKKRSFGETIDDSVISNKLKSKYVKDKLVKGFKINVDTWKGVVTLKGVVDNQEQSVRAVDIAEQQAGVKEVKSYLTIKHSESNASPEQPEESSNPWNQPRIKSQKTAPGMTETDLKTGQTENVGRGLYPKKGPQQIINDSKKQNNPDGFIDDTETTKPAKITSE